MSQISRNDSATTDTSMSTSGSTTILSTSSSESNTVSINHNAARIRSGFHYLSRDLILSPSSEAKSYNIYIDDSDTIKSLKEIKLKQYGQSAGLRRR